MLWNPSICTAILCIKNITAIHAILGQAQSEKLHQIGYELTLSLFREIAEHS